METLFRDHPEIAQNGLGIASVVKNCSEIVHFSDYLLEQEKVLIFMILNAWNWLFFRMRFTEIDQCGTPPQSPKIFLSCFQKAPRIFALKSFSSKFCPRSHWLRLKVWLENVTKKPKKLGGLWVWETEFRCGFMLIILRIIKTCQMWSIYYNRIYLVT